MKTTLAVAASLAALAMNAGAQVVSPRVPSDAPAPACTISIRPTETPYRGDIPTQCDLDGDATPETIAVSFNPDGWSFGIRVNQVSVQGSGAGLNETFAIVDVDTLDGWREIAISESGSDDNVTHFYAWDGSRIFSMGSIEGSGDIRVDGSGLLRAVKRGEVLQVWSYPVLYRLGPDHRLERIEMDLYPMNTPVRLKKPLQLVRSRTNPIPGPKLAAGDAAVILSSDGMRWCLVRLPDGATGWFEIDSEGRMAAGKLSPADVFEGLRLE